MNMEIEGHEFWGADGKNVWYDLQTPKSQVFWLASYNLETGCAHVVQPADRRMVGTLQRVAGRKTFRWRRRRAEQRGRGTTANGFICSALRSGQTGTVPICRIQRR